MDSQKTVLLVSSQHRNWILDFLARDICLKFGFKIHYLPTRKIHTRKLNWKKLPIADRYILMHQSLYEFILRKKLKTGTAQIEIFFTHESEIDFHVKEQLPIKKIYCMSQEQKNKLIETYPHMNIVIAIGGPDDKDFPFSPKPTIKKTILVSDFKRRKNPLLVEKVIKEIPDWSFILHGKEWGKFIEGCGLSKNGNFEYFEFDFRNSANLYNKAPVFLSLSRVEGGPLPAIEALLTGCSVVLTDTGFARDLAAIFPNVFIISTDPSILEVKNAIEEAFIAPPATPDQLRVISQESFFEHFSN